MTTRLLVLMALVAAAFGGRLTLDHPVEVRSAEPLAAFPVQIGSWRSHDQPLTTDVLQVAAVDDYLNRVYESGPSQLGLYIGYYRSQRQGEALHSPLFCLPGAGWQPVQTHGVTLPAARGRAVAVNELIVERGLDRLGVLYWYQTLRRVTASEYRRKLFLMSDAFTSGRTDVALVRVIAPIRPEDEDPDAALGEARPFASQVLPEIQKRLFKEE
jgi:EpsI family protein